MPGPDPRGGLLERAAGAVSDLFARLAPAFYVGGLCLMLACAVSLAFYRRVRPRVALP